MIPYTVYSAAFINIRESSYTDNSPNWAIFLGT